MVFVDGENLSLRYQSMVKNGWTPIPGAVTHEKDVLVWVPHSLHIGLHVVLRATYYTYIQGSQEHLGKTCDRIKALSFNNYRPVEPSYFGYLPSNLTPCVFTKTKGRKAKGVDIQIAVDMLTHAYQDNCDSVYLVSGDGDYVPVLAEVQRLGKQVFVSAFSDGLSSRLRQMADSFQVLDAYYFQEAAEGRVPLPAAVVEATAAPGNSEPNGQPK